MSRKEIASSNQKLGRSWQVHIHTLKHPSDLRHNINHHQNPDDNHNRNHNRWENHRPLDLPTKYKGAKIYPAIVVTVMFIVGVLMMIYVVPQITGVFKGMDMDLPATTKFLIATSDFFAAHTLLTLAIMIGTVVGTMYFLKSKVGRLVTSWVIPRLPVIGTMAKETNSARTARTLSSLLNSGVDVIQAIEITEEVVQNVFYKKILKDARMRVEKGTPLSEVFIERTDLYPI